MSGLNFYTGNDPYAALGIRGRLGQEFIFRIRDGNQQCYPYTPPSNPRTPRQQAWRWHFAQAVLYFHSLTSAQKLVYTSTAARRGRASGFNFVVSEYLQRFSSNS